MESFLQSEAFITAIIASGSALLGVLVSQGIGFWKLKSEHKYERQIFLRKKYEELVFRLIDFSMIIKSLGFTLQQETNNININGFIEKGGQIEVIAVLYFPKLVNECNNFLDISQKLYTAEYFYDRDPSNDNINNLEMLKTKFDESYDVLYNKIQSHISDYTWTFKLYKNPSQFQVE